MLTYIFIIIFYIILLYYIINSIYNINNPIINKISNCNKDSLNIIENPPILYINLDKRKDRRDNILKEFSNWYTIPERVPAVEYNPGWKGCSASHIKCIKIAIERDYPWVLIIEDDCVLTSDALKQFTSLLPLLWEKRHDWDLFYGGPSYVWNVKKLYDNPSIYQVNAYSTHFCLINKSSYKKIIDNYPKNIKNYNQAIDVYYSTNFRIWTTKPYFVKQIQSDLSDIQNGKIDYDYNKTFNDKLLE